MMSLTAKAAVARRVAGFMGHSQGLLTRTFVRSRLQSTLAILEQKDGQLNHGSLSAFTAAQKLGGPVHGFIAGSNISSAAQEAAKVNGVDKIITVDNVAYDKVIIPDESMRTKDVCART